MNRHAIKLLGIRWAAGFLIASTAFLVVPMAEAAVLVDDSWADGGFTDGADPLDSNWWTSYFPDYIEVSTGSLGMVTGNSAEGIHTVFPTQTLGVHDRLIATYTFTTPGYVSRLRLEGFRVGLFDTLGRAGLNDNIYSQSSSPQSLYGYYGTNTPGLPGYVMTMDSSPGSQDLSFYQHDTAVNPVARTPTGVLLQGSPDGLLKGFTLISPTGPDGVYSFEPNSTYTGSFAVERINATQMRITGSLGSATHSVTDTFDSASFGMLAFYASATVFGITNVPGVPNNGIDFSNIRIEVVPEPGAAVLTMFCVALLCGTWRRRD